MSNPPEQHAVDRPIFLCGMPRSGTTILFESFARNPDVGWFSYHLDRTPRFAPTAITARLCGWSSFFRKEVSPAGEDRRWLERFRDGPSEAYRIWEAWCGEKFRYAYLLDERATPEERAGLRRFVKSVLRWQGKPRFAAKLTGPARLGYLESIFDDAHFVHIVRDGRAVVNSLLNVGFWKDTQRMHEPAWRDGLAPEHLERWEQSGRSPLVLTALQWRNVLERTWQEREANPPSVFFEIRYEDFLADPEGTMQGICDAVDIPFAPEARRWLTGQGVRQGDELFRERFSDEELATLNDLLGDLLERLGYRI